MNVMQMQLLWDITVSGDVTCADNTLKKLIFFLKRDKPFQISLISRLVSSKTHKY